MKKILLIALLSMVAQADPTALSVVTSSETPAATAANACNPVSGNSVANVGGNVFLVLYNSDTANNYGYVTVTPFTTTASIAGVGNVVKSAQTASVAQRQTVVMGPFPTNMWNDQNGNLSMTCSGSANNIKISPLKLP